MSVICVAVIAVLSLAVLGLKKSHVTERIQQVIDIIAPTILLVIGMLFLIEMITPT
jgi:hypothetical protein